MVMARIITMSASSIGVGGETWPAVDERAFSLPPALALPHHARRLSTMRQPYQPHAIRPSIILTGPGISEPETMWVAIIVVWHSLPIHHHPNHHPVDYITSRYCLHNAFTQLT